MKTSRHSLLSGGKASKMPSLSRLRDVTALQPYVTISSRDPDHLALPWDTLVYYTDDILPTGPNEQDV